MDAGRRGEGGVAAEGAFDGALESFAGGGVVEAFEGVVGAVLGEGLGDVQLEGEAGQPHDT